jgi:hypothetical protein
VEPEERTRIREITPALEAEKVLLGRSELCVQPHPGDHLTVETAVAKVKGRFPHHQERGREPGAGVSGTEPGLEDQTFDLWVFRDQISHNSQPTMPFGFLGKTLLTITVHVCSCAPHMLLSVLCTQSWTPCWDREGAVKLVTSFETYSPLGCPSHRWQPRTCMFWSLPSVLSPLWEVDRSLLCGSVALGAWVGQEGPRKRGGAWCEGCWTGSVWSHQICCPLLQSIGFAGLIPPG